MTKTGGIYIHIPFCEQKCLYCDFASFVTKKDVKEKYFASLVKSLSERYEAAFFVVGAPGDKPYAQEVIQAVDIQVLMALKTGHIVTVTLVVAEKQVLAVRGVYVFPISQSLLNGGQRRMIVHLVLYPVLL